MTIELITFDLDDTLWDTAPVIVSAEAVLRHWLGDADVFSTQHKFEVVPQADSPYIGVAIGDHAQAVITGQCNKGRFSLGEHVQCVTRLNKDFKRIIS